MFHTWEDDCRLYSNLSIRHSQTLSQSVYEILEEIFKNTNNIGNTNLEDFNMPKITNYNYNEDTTVTTIEWSDGTKTTVHAEHPDTADPYTGFCGSLCQKSFRKR